MFKIPASYLNLYIPRTEEVMIRAVGVMDLPVRVVYHFICGVDARNCDTRA